MKKIILLLFFIGLYQLNAQELDIRAFASGFNRPVTITHAGDDRLFIVEQTGLIRILQEDGSINTQPFLDLSSQISTGGERGLLGLAFHPDYSDTGYFYVNYTNIEGNTQISRFSVDANNSEIADPTSEMEMLNLEQPYENHNGGCLAFGPDGYLYIGLGDGGGSGDPQNRAQDTSTLYGSILRINVDGDLPYSIPADNPFVGDDDQRDEIWAYGLRNPWKFSFDEPTGDFWIADVGQDQMEEINQTAAGTAGLNYGWHCYEGDLAYNDSNCPEASELSFPLATYEHQQGRASITGGYVYHGEDYPALQGRYIFADFVSNELGFIGADNTLNFFGPFEDTGFTGFGVNSKGKLYVAGISSGTIYEVIDGSNLNLDKTPQTSISLYPNPAKGSVFIQIPDFNKQVLFSIFDILGKKVLSKSITSVKSQVDISTLKKGVYLAQFESANGSNRTHKLIVH